MSFFRDLLSMVSSYIQFEDADTKESLINNDAINIDGDHEISYKEAAAYNTAPTNITVAGESFKEFQYFTGVTKCQINGENLKILTLPPNATSKGYGNQSLTYYCPNLEEITIISRFNSGSDNVFANNKSLSKVNVINDTDDILSSVLGSNNGWFSNTNNGGYFYYKNNIIHSITVHSITSIGSGVLRKDKSITSIDFNNKIISIGYMSFRDSVLQYISNTNSVVTLSINCFRNSKIINVTFNNVTSELLGTFAQCSNLTDISLPLVTKLSLSEAVGAFENCSNLVNCNIPLVTSIGDRSFTGCSNLIELNCSPVTIGNFAMFNCSKFESFNSTSNIVSIGIAAFHNCKKFNQINFNNVTNIAKSAFFDCSGLTEIELKNNNFKTLSGSNTGSAVDGGVFQRCVNLTKIDAPNITIIQANACNGCSKLTTITWNWDNITTIGASAFADCSALNFNSITFGIDSVISSIGDGAFRGSAIKNITINNNTLRSLSGFNNTAMNSVVAPNVTSIGYQAFIQGSVTTPMSFPNVTKIANQAFYQANIGNTIDLPNVEWFGDNCFYKSTGLRNLGNNFSWNKVRFIGNSAFDGTTIDMPSELYCKCIGHAAFRLDVGGTPSSYVIFRFDGSDISDISDYPTGANGQDLIRNGVVGFTKFLDFNWSPFTIDVKTIYVPDNKKQLYLDSIWGQLTIPNTTTPLIIKGYSEADFIIN